MPRGLGLSAASRCGLASLKRAGVDGNDIKLFISTPTGSGPFPCLYHTHGGGMAMQMAEDLCYTMIRDMYVRHVSRALIGAMSSDSL